MINWWTNRTRQQYEERTQCLIEKFNNYTYKGIPLRGAQTLSENLADDIGVKTSFQAFQRVKQQQPRQKLIGSTLTEDQLFFVGWAQLWCSVCEDKMAKVDIVQDVHTLYKFRVIGPLSNSDDFAAAFNCPAGSPMHRPENKCSVW